MSRYENKLIENQTVDLSSFPSSAVNCHFRNCQIKMADNNEGEECKLINVIFEDCVIIPSKIHFRWFNQNHPVVFKNTKVDLIGDVIQFFWNGKAPYGDRANSLGDRERNYVNYCFSGCTINGKEISVALSEYETSHNIVSNDIDSFIEGKLSEIPRKH